MPSANIVRTASSLVYVVANADVDAFASSVQPAEPSARQTSSYTARLVSTSASNPPSARGICRANRPDVRKASISEEGSVPPSSADAASCSTSGLSERAMDSGSVTAWGIWPVCPARTARRGQDGAVTTFVALLRAVNVGGNNKIAMPALRVTLEALGYSEVTTYIQSGNIVFD